MTTTGFAFSRARLEEIADDLLRFARQRGASACEVSVSEGYGYSVTVRQGEVETIEYNRDKGVGVTVYLGQQRGNASTSDLSPAALEAAVEAATSIAGFTAPDPAAGLADPELLAREPLDLDLDHPWDLAVDGAIALAEECEEAAFATGARIRNSEGASVSTQRSQFVAANSAGFVGGYATSRHGISCSVIGGEEEDDPDGMQREYWYDARRVPSELAAARDVGRIAGERTLARLGARRIPTCEVPVIFEAPLAVSLLGNFVHAASGGALYRKTSFLTDALDTAVFSPQVRISERAHLPRAFGCSPFDNDGVATRSREVVSEGILRGYFLSVYSARKLGMQTTGNSGGSHNLLLHPTLDGGLEALLAQMDRGLLVTELLGQGVNYVTGDYSRGAAGFWVENGRIVHPVEEITIAGNLKDMFRDIVAVGNDGLNRGAKIAGSVLLGRMKVAGE